MAKNSNKDSPSRLLVYLNIQICHISDLERMLIKPFHVCFLHLPPQTLNLLRVLPYRPTVTPFNSLTHLYLPGITDIHPLFRGAILAYLHFLYLTQEVLLALKDFPEYYEGGVLVEVRVRRKGHSEIGP